MPNQLPHQITLESAIEMTTFYRQNRPDNFPVCETFDKAAVLKMLSNDSAVALRIYYGMKADMTVHAILVASDSKGNDILPMPQGHPGHGGHGHGSGGDGDGEILEDSIRCPDICPPDSPLNNG